MLPVFQRRLLARKRVVFAGLVAAVAVGAGLGAVNLLASAPAVAMGAPAADKPAAAAPAAPAGEFDQAQVNQGFKIWKEKIVCGECHGWSGNGLPDNPRQPKGMNLRETQLSHAELVEVIKCGRPGTGMPHFDQRAYKDDRCYGVTEADLGDQTPPGWGTSLIGREVEAVATYIEAKIKGRGPFTNEECLEYFGEGAQVCAQYELNRGNAAPQN